MDRNKAIKVLKDFWSVYEIGTEIREAFETLIPELKESEDERIRKGLMEYLKELKEQSVEGSHLKRPEHYDAWIAWLEKQGEQNLANSAKTCKIEQNPAWSEEDEDYRLNVNVAVDDYFDEGYAEELRGWLKSLKDRYTWKPSEEQITQLSKYCPDNRPLTSLYNALKKLKG